MGKKIKVGNRGKLKWLSWLRVSCCAAVKAAASSIDPPATTWFYDFFSLNYIIVLSTMLKHCKAPLVRLSLLSDLCQFNFLVPQKKSTVAAVKRKDKAGFLNRYVLEKHSYHLHPPLDGIRLDYSGMLLLALNCRRRGPSSIN